MTLHKITEGVIIIVWCWQKNIYEAYIYQKSKQIYIYEDNKLILRKYNLRDEELKEWIKQIQIMVHTKNKK